MRLSAALPTLAAVVWAGRIRARRPRPMMALCLDMAVPQRPPTVTGRFLPPQASLVPDQLDVAVPLVGAVPASGLGAAVERGGMTTSTGGSG